MSFFKKTFGGCRKYKKLQRQLLEGEFIYCAFCLGSFFVKSASSLLGSLSTSFMFNMRKTEDLVLSVLFELSS